MFSKKEIRKVALNKKRLFYKMRPKILEKYIHININDFDKNREFEATKER